MSCFDRSIYDQAIERDLDEYLDQLDYYDEREYCLMCDHWSLEEDFEVDGEANEMKCPNSGAWITIT